VPSIQGTAPEMRRLTPLPCVIAAGLAAILLAACGGDAEPPSPPGSKQAEAVTSASPKQQAEASLLPGMSAPLADAVRRQAWFQELSPAGYALVEAVQKCERAAQARGERDSVVAILEYAAEQPWYGDGLDDTEAAALRGVFFAYAESLSDTWAPQIGTVLATTIEHQLVEVMELPESGELLLLVSADDPSNGRRALSLARDALPDIEQLVGRFPYAFLHITVTELPELFAGLSYDEFIALAPDSVDAPTVIHEITHSTLYGIFPLWFEEGFAHFMEYYLTDALSEGTAYFKNGLRYLGYDERLDVRPNGAYSLGDELAERAQGFLFVKGLFEINGMVTINETIRSLRTKSFSDQDLIKTLVQNSPPNLRTELRAYVCKNVRGTTHNYCSAQ
jgi:hypothetical protein